MRLHPLRDELLVRPSAVSSAHLITSLPFRPTLALSVPNFLSGGGTHLVLLRGRCLLGSITGQQSTGLFELSNFGVNRSENFVCRHAVKYTQVLSWAPRFARIRHTSSHYTLFGSGSV